MGKLNLSSASIAVYCIVPFYLICSFPIHSLIFPPGVLYVVVFS